MLIIISVDKYTLMKQTQLQLSQAYIEINNFNIINITNFMLNLFELYFNKKTEKKNFDPQKKHNKHYPSAVRE